MAGRIYDRLRTHFGEDALFIDMDSIPYGVDFREHIAQAVDKCGVMLAVIGPNWSGKSESGRRIDDARDFVRIEVEVALQRRLPVIPVLIDRTPMPAESDLPPSLSALAYRNAIDIDQWRDFHHHVDRLIKGIEYLFEQAKRAPVPPAAQPARALASAPAEAKPRRAPVEKRAEVERKPSPRPVVEPPAVSPGNAPRAGGKIHETRGNPPDQSVAALFGSLRTAPTSPAQATRSQLQSAALRLPRVPWLWAYLLALPLLAILGVVIHIVTDTGTVKITGTDPSMVLRIDSREIRIENLGEPITLRTGPHDMIVTRGDMVVSTQTFQIQRGQETPLHVTFTPKPRPPEASPSAARESEAAKTESSTAKSEATKPASSGESKRTPAMPRREWTNSIGMKLVRIEPGVYLMGSPESDKEASDDEKPQHRVLISKAFYLGAHEVTQGQYQAVMGNNPSTFKGSDDLPAETVSWLDAVAFCNKLSEHENRTPCYLVTGDQVINGNGYRLPTEAEWEYACRYPFSDGQTSLGEHAWYDANSERKTHPVGQKRPNAWGLYDMLGNVWEWTGDWYDKKYYSSSPPTDPRGAAKGSFRVSRGDCWFDDASDCRPASRKWGVAGLRDSVLGFRVAVVQE
jgi:formylglycine-generating enzyme required for sulfatase activity